MKPAIYLQKNCCPSLIIMTLLEVKRNCDSVRLYYRKNHEKIIMDGEGFGMPLLVQENHRIVVHDLYAIVHYIHNRSMLPWLLPLDMQIKMNMLIAIKLLFKHVTGQKTPILMKQQLTHYWPLIQPCLSPDGPFMLLDYILYALSIFLVEENNLLVDDQQDLKRIFESLRDHYKISLPY